MGTGSKKWPITVYLKISGWIQYLINYLFLRAYTFFYDVTLEIEGISRRSGTMEFKSEVKQTSTRIIKKLYIYLYICHFWYIGYMGYMGYIGYVGYVGYVGCIGCVGCVGCVGYVG